MSELRNHLIRRADIDSISLGALSSTLKGIYRTDQVSSSEVEFSRKICPTFALYCEKGGKLRRSRLDKFYREQQCGFSPLSGKQDMFVFLLPMLLFIFNVGGLEAPFKNDSHSTVRPLLF